MLRFDLLQFSRLKLSLIIEFSSFPHDRSLPHHCPRVVVFTSYTKGNTRHKKTWCKRAVTIIGADNTKQRMNATDAFQNDPNFTVALCNLIAGVIGFNRTSQSTTDSFGIIKK